MNHTLFSEINGKSIRIDHFEIETNDETLDIKMMCMTENGNTYGIAFENVSMLKLSSISYPFQIHGFEILDYSSCGYEKDHHFFVNDYEDGKLSFFCENYYKI